MSTVAFMPWYTLDAPRTTCGYVLRPWHVDGAGQGASDPVKAVLSAYRHPNGEPVESATIVSLPDVPQTASLTEDQKDAMWRFGEMVAFATLAARDVAGFPWRYVNRDSLRLVIQDFKDEPGHVTLTVRRRAGVEWRAVNEDTYRVYRPEHAVQSARVMPDWALLEAAMAARGTLPRLHEAVVRYNEANTDDATRSQDSEVVDLAVAFALLLGEDKAFEASDALDRLWQVEALDWPPCTHTGHGRKREPAWVRSAGVCARTAGVWMRNFVWQRNEAAHGNLSPKDEPNLWLRHEHLALASIAFPLAVKLALAKLGGYSLGDEDVQEVFAFPYRAVAGLQEERDEERLWSSVDDEVTFHPALMKEMLHRKGIKLGPPA